LTKNLSVNSYFIKFPLWKRGIKGDFAIKRFSNPPSPPFAKGGKLITDKFLLEALSAAIRVIDKF